MPSQLLHYPRELSPHWLDLAHVVAGAPMHPQAARIASPHRHQAYTEELPVQVPASAALAHAPAWSRMTAVLGAPGRFAVSFAAAVVSLALPGSSWFIDTLRH